MQSIHGLDIPNSLADLATPERMALLVYDMQVGICRQVESEHVKKRAGVMLAAAREAGFRIAYTRHLSLPTAWMGVMQYRTAMAWQRKADPAEVSPWFLRDSPGFDIVPELAPSADEAVFDKLAMSAFEGTPLHFALSDAGIRALAMSASRWRSASNPPRAMLPISALYRLSSRTPSVGATRTRPNARSRGCAMLAIQSSPRLQS
jgi:biuret amidohydrolase